MYVIALLPCSEDVADISQAWNILRGSALPPQRHYHAWILRVLVLNLENDNLLYRTVLQQKARKQVWKHFSKMQSDVGLAVPKTTETRHMDGSVQAIQRTTQVTLSLHHFFE